MSRTKKLTRARKREAELRAKIELAETVRDEAIVEMRAAYTTIRDLQRQLVEVEDVLRPAVERIMGIRLNDRWYFADPVEQKLYVLKEPPMPPPMPNYRFIDTHRKLQVTYTIADEVLLEMLERAGRDKHHIVERYFVKVGTNLLKRAVQETLAAKEKR